MSLTLEEDESFSLSAYVDSLGDQRIALSGYLVSHRGDGTYVAPLIPQLFYGVNGTQLQTWRQNFTATGDQVILSRSGGLPKVPREDLYWRKVEGAEQPKTEQPVTPVVLAEAPNYWIIPTLVLGAGIAIYAIYRLSK